MKHFDKVASILKKNCARIIQQWDNLFQYFIVFYLSKKRFNREIKGTILFQSIKQNLKSELTLPYFTFVSFITLVMFQSIEPIIHLLYERIADL